MTTGPLSRAEIRRMRRAAEAVGATMMGDWSPSGPGSSGAGNNPNSSRLIDWGHSWVAPPPFPYGVGNIASADILGNPTQPWTGEIWTYALRDALGIGSGVSFFRTYSVPGAATAADATTFLDFMPDDGTIDAVYYVPNGAITTGSLRQVSIQTQGWFAKNTLASFTFASAGVQGTPVKVWSMNDLVAAAAIASPYFPALRISSGGTAMLSQELYWQSTHLSTGTADPGGTVIIRFGTRYRNYGVGGSSLLGPNGDQGQDGGGWNGCLSWSPFSRPNAIEVDVATTAAGGATSITCSALEYPINSGQKIAFPNGVIATLTAPAGGLATSITVAALSGSVPAGSQGHVQNINGLGGGAYETLSPTGINVWTHGINDSDNATQDVNAWTEVVRSVLCKNICPAWLYPWNGTTGAKGNCVFTNGGGTWGNVQQPANGALPFAFTNVANNNMPYWSGTVSGSPSFVMSIGPAFEGGTVDLIFLAPAGSSLGVAGSITVDGGTPPQGAVTINTSGVSVSGLLTYAPGGTVSATASTTITGAGTTFTSAMIGELLTGTGGTGSIPAGTIITAVASATSITVNNTVTVNGATPSVSGWVPMVKRITGLSPGAHTVTFTITGSDSVANSVILFYGLGLESQNPPTPVMWCNIARSPHQSGTQQSNAVALNAASLAVINGTAVPLTGNTPEPGFKNPVRYVDIDSLLNGSASSTNFLADGLHPNSKGHRALAVKLFETMQEFYTPAELISR